MGINKIVAKQYRDKANQALRKFNGFSMLPPEGWLRTIRSALGMSGPQLASRLGVSKARISKAEKDEISGSLTLKTMQNMAEAMGCKFVYAVIPAMEVEKMIKRQAIKKAQEKVKSASTHMALEAQALSKDQLAFEIERIAAEIVAKMPADLWNDQ